VSVAQTGHVVFISTEILCDGFGLKRTEPIVDQRPNYIVRGLGNQHCDGLLTVSIARAKARVVIHILCDCTYLQEHGSGETKWARPRKA
jgi:hypothetical protein